MTASPPFRLAIIGAGLAAESLHLPAALASELVEVTAIVDPAVERAEALARTFGLTPEIASRIGNIRGPLDGAVIATPNNTHRDLAVACATAGLHCLIEKPLASSVAEAEEICALAAQHRVTIAVGYATRFRNEVELLKELLDSAYFGNIRRFYFQDGVSGGWSPASGYNLDRAASGGGVLVVVGTHFLDRMLYWFGYPDECEMADDAGEGPEAQCVVSVRYRRPGQSFDGTIRMSKVFGLPPGLVIDAENGQVMLGLGTSPLLFRPHANPGLEVVLRRRGKPYFPADVDNFQLQLEDFVAACREKRAPRIDARQGLLSVRLLNELYSRRKPLSEPWLRRSSRSATPAASMPRAERIKVAVFGASGFVGATLVERLNRQNIDCVAAIHSPGNAWRLARHGLPLSIVDVLSRTAVGDVMRGCTHVVNCTRGPDDAMIGGLENLLAEAKLQGIRRFIHLSSVAVYGDPPPPESTQEESEARPTPGSYGALKLRQDGLIARAHGAGLSCAILCPPNIIGVYSDFVCNVLDDMRRGRFALVEDGRMPINVVDVENLAYAIELALMADRVDGRRMFVTDGNGITWRDFTDKLRPLAEIVGPLPSLPAGEVAWPIERRRRASLTRTIKHVVSSEVRNALRSDPVFGKVEEWARASAGRLPEALQERLRHAIGGPIQIAKVSTAPGFQSRYIQQQLRGVTYSCARAARVIGYSPVIDFGDSMAQFCSWYVYTRGMDSEIWPLARQLLPS